MRTGTFLLVVTYVPDENLTVVGMERYKNLTYDQPFTTTKLECAWLHPG